MEPKDWVALAAASRATTPVSLDSDAADADGSIRLALWRYIFPAMDLLGREPNEH